MLESDESLLKELAAECKDAKEKVRYLSLHAVSKGHVVSLVAEIFCVDEATVYRWIERWEEEKSLADKPKEGREPSFDEKEKENLKKLVKEDDPKEYGINASLWDCKELQKYFLMKGKEVSQDTIRRCLKKMGARYVKAVLQYAEADEQVQRDFAKRFLEELRAKPNSVLVLFQDEMSAETSPRKGYGWTFEKRLVVKAPQKDVERINCFGAVNPLKGEVIEMTSENAKTPAFIRFLRKLLKMFRNRRLWVYADGNPTHKSGVLKHFLEKHPRLELKRLPPYSPDLNPKEEWHRFLRSKLLNNEIFESRRALVARIHNFTKNTSKEIVKSVCSLKHIYALAT